MRIAENGDVLVLVDVLANFEHADGESLLDSYRGAVSGLRAAIAAARASEIPVVYANDDFGTWSGGTGSASWRSRAAAVPNRT
jgi:nicotinamidase-related amidase